MKDCLVYIRWVNEYELIDFALLEAFYEVSRLGSVTAARTSEFVLRDPV